MYRVLSLVPNFWLVCTLRRVANSQMVSSSRASRSYMSCPSEDSRRIREKLTRSEISCLFGGVPDIEKIPACGRAVF